MVETGQRRKYKADELGLLKEGGKTQKNAEITQTYRTVQKEGYSEL